MAPSTLRALRRDLVEINDAQLLQIVALIDRMADRGDADGLIAPLRSRFRRVRPPRPLRFARLLFLPLHPVLIAPPLFRAGMPAVPRTALVPLAGVVHAALGPRAREIEAMIAGRVETDTETIQAAGMELWPAAAAALIDAGPSAGWSLAGLPVALHAPLSRAIAAVLAQASALYELICDVAAGLPVEPGRVDGFLTRAAPTGQGGWSLVLSVLLAHLPATGTVLHQATQWAARRRDQVLVAAIEQVLETELTLLEAHGTAMVERLNSADLTTVSREVRRIVDLLDAFAGTSPPAARRARAEAVRRDLDANCRARFADALTEDLLAPLQAMTGPPAADVPPRLEAAARHLRALETVARRLGSAATYDTLLRQTAAAVRGVAADARLQLPDTVRLVEILAGPDAALSLLG
jgi:hypothetical protein